MHAKRLRSVPEADGSGISLPTFKRAYVGAVHPHYFGNACLGHVGLEPIPPDIRPDDMPHIHAT